MNRWITSCLDTEQTTSPSANAQLWLLPWVILVDAAQRKKKKNCLYTLSGFNVLLDFQAGVSIALNVGDFISSGVLFLEILFFFSSLIARCWSYFFKWGRSQRKIEAHALKRATEVLRCLCDVTDGAWHSSMPSKKIGPNNFENLMMIVSQNCDHNSNAILFCFEVGKASLFIYSSLFLTQASSMCFTQLKIHNLKAFANKIIYDIWKQRRMKNLRHLKVKK